MNEERIPKKVLNMKVKGRHSRGRPRSRGEQQVRKDVTQREGREAMGRSHGGGVVGRWTQMQRLGSQRAHLKWKHLRNHKLWSSSSHAVFSILLSLHPS
jgi:hypothetical protein